MNWKAFWGILGLFVFIISTGGIIYQLINWDNEYWELVMNIVYSIVGLSLAMEWRKTRDGELMVEEEENKDSTS
tara:strand:- start:6 stop:227 length:222 start_codon:yes stop_codon:yes gene_type:complete